MNYNNLKTRDALVEAGATKFVIETLLLNGEVWYLQEDREGHCRYYGDTDNPGNVVYIKTNIEL